MNPPSRRWLTLGVVCLAIVLLGWVVSAAELSTTAAPIPKVKSYSDDASSSGTASHVPTANLASPRPIPKTTFGATLMEVLTVVMYVLVIAGIVALIGYGLYWLFVKRPSGWDKVDTRTASQPDTEQLRQAVRAGLSEIDAGGDPRKAVIACWLRLERAAAQAGVPRLDTETPTDLMHRVLAECQVDDRALAELAAAYHRARYAPHEITGDDRETARAALSAVDAQLTSGRQRTEPA